MFLLHNFVLILAEVAVALWYDVRSAAIDAVEVRTGLFLTAAKVHMLAEWIQSTYLIGEAERYKNGDKDAFDTRFVEEDAHE